MRNSALGTPVPRSPYADLDATGVGVEALGLGQPDDVVRRRGKLVGRVLDQTDGLHEVVAGQGAGEPGPAAGGQRVAGSGPVVTDSSETKGKHTAFVIAKFQ
jgi:hypothetical protein